MSPANRIDHLVKAIIPLSMADTDELTRDLVMIKDAAYPSGGWPPDDPEYFVRLLWCWAAMKGGLEINGARMPGAGLRDD